MAKHAANSEPEVFIRDLSEDAREVVVKKLISSGDAFTEGLMNWGFEVIKHLAVFNGAGLAGSAAFAQAYSADPAVHKLALSGAHLFVAGLMVALLTMVVCFLIGFAHHLTFTRKTTNVLFGNEPLGALKLTTGLWVGTGLIWALTAVSIVLFFIGALRIVAIA
jgi:hypothetical protein